MEWWQSRSRGAAHIDFTRPEAVAWFRDRVQRIQREDGIESFKFDAGESSWMPKVSRVPSEAYPVPQSINSMRVPLFAEFGVERRTT